MFKYIINWFMSWWNEFYNNKKIGKRIDFTVDEHKVEGYMFTPPIFNNNKLIIYCHGGWATFPDVPKFVDVDYYVRCGYNVFVLRYDDEFTPEPMDLDLEKDVADVYYARMYYVTKWVGFGFKATILIGVSRGGFVALHSSIKHDLFDLVVIGCAPSDIEAWDKWGVFKLIGEGVKSYFYQWPSPINNALILSKQPLILIHGMKDDIVPFDQSANLAREILLYAESVRLRLFSDRGHALMNDKLVLKYIAKRLDKL